jgi:hypothetical protein
MTLDAHSTHSPFIEADLPEVDAAGAESLAPTFANIWRLHEELLAAHDEAEADRIDDALGDLLAQTIYHGDESDARKALAYIVAECADVLGMPRT